MAGGVIMTTITYSDQQRAYLTQRPANVIQWMTAELFHPDAGYIRLVRNEVFSKTFEGEVFTGVPMELPGVTNQLTDTTQAGTMQFGRVGLQTMQYLLAITPRGAITHPINVRIRTYEKDIESPIYDRLVYANSNGISIGEESVTVQLSVSNPSKLTNEDTFYDPAIFKGLENL